MMTQSEIERVLNEQERQRGIEREKRDLLLEQKADLAREEWAELIDVSYNESYTEDEKEEKCREIRQYYYERVTKLIERY